MYKLVVLADDFTGALDTGVQFSKQGISTLVTTDKDYDFKKNYMKIQVLVVNLESRHLPPSIAYEHVLNITERILGAGVKYIYNKTDSGLRGNIGSELTAIVHGTGGKSISFVPAYPKAKRTTKKGIHYIDGVPVTQSVFGQDPFEPVRNDSVEEIIKEQSSIKTKVVTVEEIEDFTFEGVDETVLIFDATTDNDMERIAEKIKASKTQNIIAGCAGFAEKLAKIFEIDADCNKKINASKGLIVASGSINQVTIEQIDYARSQGFQTITLKPEEKLSENILDLSNAQDLVKEIEGIFQREGKIIIEATNKREVVESTNALASELGFTLDEARKRISDNMGRLMGSLVQRNMNGTFVIFGGDTLKAVIDALGSDGIMPLLEIDNGIVLSKVVMREKMINIISKSGGFGEVDTLIKIENFLVS